MCEVRFKDESGGRCDVSCRDWGIRWKVEMAKVVVYCVAGAHSVLEKCNYGLILRKERVEMGDA